MRESIVGTATQRKKESQDIFYFVLSIKIYQNIKKDLVKQLQTNLSLRTRPKWYWVTHNGQKEKTIKEVFCFPGLKMHVRENGRLDRNVKLFENLPYEMTHIGTYGSIWSNMHSQNFKDFVKELRER